MVQRGVLFCVLLLAITATPARAACDGAPFASSRQTLVVDGFARSFVVRAPAAYDGRHPAAVMVAFHPFGMNADYMASRVPVARAWPDAIVIYPNGAPRPGAGGGQSWQTARDTDDRDVHFFEAMISWVREHACVDARRVFAFGYSNGAGLAYLLACERSGALAGLAIASGRMGCHPSAPMPVVISHGTSDTTIPFDAAVRAAAEWATVNGCAAPPTPAIDRCVTAPSCASAPVVLCTYRGGHEYHAPFTAAAVGVLKR